MDALLLARLQFAITAMFHFLFVPLTLGISIIVAVMETLYVKTGNVQYLKMTKFWGKLFLINFALGVVTGITLEFQFGTNWAEYARYVGDIFGAPLAIEASVAFFLESTFMGIWIFGWKRISKKAHAVAVWMVAAGTSLSALWILTANAWMQHPVGYVINNGRAELVDFAAVALSGYAWSKFLHTVLGGYLVGAFFVMGVSAYHILKNNFLDFFKKSFRIAAAFALMSCLAEVAVGDWHAREVARTQPTKFAAMETIWETRQGAPIYIFAIPDEATERNTMEILPVPNMLSILAEHDPHATVQGLKDFPVSERPPVTLTFVSFRLMVGLTTLFILLSVSGYVFSRKETLEKKTWFLKIMVFSMPLPYLACQLGWLVAEVGRQPWIVYGLMKTSDAVSKNITAGQAAASLAGFAIFYGLLAVADIYLLVKFSKNGPAEEMGHSMPSGRTIPL
ncbi:cytochrome ubiquinol oxidase subunit I [Pelotomaculum isophthalicicum JI]|uniref:Cytochrome ubiquinol oxidase subunit I n=1 Tax=Pelotomaculum isophthalicicum JI TaxID=947010 RepID=A0A9X4JU90_9FIRM|nr:cytochrome ubiquinol oxidase subunit I [Pelotomaculum isophthalicicum]MDF9408695.1 cytochrome ubiquinol oxidase subunit I [Pelotomaculum isophthalicicum JI]